MAEHYAGSQWIVTEAGIEQRDGNYIIRAEDLSNDMGEGGWIGHMAEKSWVDIEDFGRAFAAAKSVS